MNEPQQDTLNDPIERLLSAQPLRRPSEALDQRIEQVLAGAGRTVAAAPRRAVIGRIGRWAGRIGAAAALVLIAFHLGRITTSVPAISPAPQVADRTTDQDEPPMRVVKQWSSVEPGPMVYASDGAPVQPLRRRVVRQESWVDPNSQVQYEITEPVEQLILVPVNKSVN